MYILNLRNNLCFKRKKKTFGKQNKLRHAKDKVKSSDLDIFLSQTNNFLLGRNHSHLNPQKEGSCQK